MTKKKKITVIVWTVCTVLILSFWLGIIWIFFGRSIKIYFKSHAELPDAKSAAAEYIEEKYGEKPDLSEYDTLTFFGGYIIPERYFKGLEFMLDGYSVKVYCGYGSTEIIDNKQYNEICSAVKEHYLYDVALGSSYTEESFSLDFDYEGEFTAEYFDGDIEDFLNKTSTAIDAKITYEGYPEKYGEYRELLNNKLEHIRSDFDSRSSSVYFYIHNPEINLPETENKYADPGQMIYYHIPRYEEYMELIACGYATRNDTAVMQTDWYDIDSFTAISCEVSPVTSNNDFIFREVDLSDNTTAYRGINVFDERANENILQIRDTGYEVKFTGGEEKGKAVFLRLDREHYGITDKTVLLLVADGEGERKGKRLYLSIGYGKYDSNYNDWYYLDDNYLYLYIEKTYIHSLEAYLTFSDIE